MVHCEVQSCGTANWCGKVCSTCIFSAGRFCLFWILVVMRSFSSLCNKHDIIMRSCLTQWVVYIYYLANALISFKHLFITRKGLEIFIPRPPPFCVLRFVFSIIHGSRRARKTGKAWSYSSREWRQVNSRWTRKWLKGEGTNSVVSSMCMLGVWMD